MIDPAYCQLMARYNRWQNAQLVDCLAPLSTEDLDMNRGAFFGSIRATLNHLIWGDEMWMSRFDGGSKPAVGIPDSVAVHPDVESWGRARSQMDDRIADWCKTVDETALRGAITWFSGVAKADVTKPLALCVVHMFNHQTHHRGQIHAMLTAAGGQAPVTDLFMMPE